MDYEHIFEIKKKKKIVHKCVWVCYSNGKKMNVFTNWIKGMHRARFNWNTAENENHNKLISNLFKKTIQNADCFYVLFLLITCFFLFRWYNHYHKFIKQMNKEINLLALCRVATLSKKNVGEFIFLYLKIFVDSFFFSVCAYSTALLTRFF